MSISERPDFKWASDADARLKELVEERLSGGQISVQLSGEFKHLVTRNAVIGRCQRLGIKLCSNKGGGRAIKIVKAAREKFPKTELLPKSIVKQLEKAFHKAVFATKSGRPNISAEEPTEPLFDDTKSVVGVPYDKLAHNGCSYELGSLGTMTRNYRFCGALVKQGKPWCDVHHARARVARK